MKQEDSSGFEAGKIFIGGLSWETSQEKLQEYFTQFGDVSDCVVMKNNETGKSRGFGFITFKDPSCVAKVLSSGPHEVDGRTIDPKVCSARDLQQGRKNGQHPKVFLGGLPPNTTETDLRSFFSRYGTVIEVVLMYDQEKKKSRGFGFLSFETEDSVKQVCAEHFVKINGKKIECKHAEPRDKRPTNNTPQPTNQQVQGSSSGWNGPPMAPGGWGQPPAPGPCGPPPMGGPTGPMPGPMGPPMNNNMMGPPPGGYPGGWGPGPYGPPQGGWGPQPGYGPGYGNWGYGPYNCPPGPGYGQPGYGYGYGGYGYGAPMHGPPVPNPPAPGTENNFQGGNNQNQQPNNNNNTNSNNTNNNTSNNPSPASQQGPPPPGMGTYSQNDSNFGPMRPGYGYGYGPGNYGPPGNYPPPGNYGPPQGDSSQNNNTNNNRQGGQSLPGYHPYRR